MIKKITYFISVLCMISSCEKDDICTQNPLTPSLILRFYDAEDISALKTATSLYVWADGKDSIYQNVTTDSIAIPLNSTCLLYTSPSPRD